MKIIRLKYLLLTLAIVASTIAFSQGDITDHILEEVDNINMVYKPVIGVGIGTFNFLGDVRNPNLALFNGSLGYKVNVTTFLDNEHYIRANFFFMGGTVSGNERSVNLNTDNSVDLSRNLNFKSDLLLFGVSLNYDFDNFFKTYRKVHPFISVGIETLTFDSKIDSLDANGSSYNYWSDGSIRDLAEPNDDALTVQRDYSYETSLRQFDWGLGDYPQYAFAVPVDVGFDFWLSDRVLFRVGTAYHFVFTDVIDHVSYKNDASTGGVVGEKGNDNFIYSYFSLHLDLFSSDKTLEVERFFKDIEWDPTLMGNEDGDNSFDGYDQCPNTPWGVEVDSVGCPLDNDLDGIPNYLDDEPNSRYGAIVDERGVEMSKEELIARIDQTNAIDRKDLSKYLREPSSYANYKKFNAKEVPEKYLHVDTDEDSYISFDEMMDAIDGFFDFDSELNTDDIYELNEFFFAQ